jgi:hypothetical protein
VKREFKISKLDAAKRQLETAIRLYFSNDDPVSIHMLAAAAYNVLHDVTKQRGADPMIIKGHMLEMVKPEYKKMIIEKVNEAENFFKHADRDHEATLDFNPDMTDMRLIDACAQYSKLAGEEPPLFVIYRVWFTLKYPEAFILVDELKKALEANATSIVQMGRSQYFSYMLPLIMRIAGPKGVGG